MKRASKLRKAGIGCGLAVRDDVVESALWFRGVLDTSNLSFVPLLFDRSRYLVLKGGGGSGKSVFAGRKVLENAITESGSRWLVVRKVARTLRESCFEQLKRQAREHYADHIKFIPRGKSGDMYIRLINGSEILFAGLDDVEKLKSIYEITGIWIEEASEVSEEDFNQLDIRLRADFVHGLQMILSFNPISINHWLKKRFFDRRNPEARVHESTYRDNRFLAESQVRVLEGFKDTDEYYYTVYCLGEWGITGKTVFVAQAIAARLAVLSGPMRTGLFEYDESEDGIRLKNIRWVDDDDGPVRIYLVPEKGRPYVIGGDTAGEGSDWFTGQVLDNASGQQVAVLRHRYDEDTYAKQMYCLGKHYNDALIGIEVNYSTYPVKLLGLMGYSRQYVREVGDNFEGRMKKAFGFETNRITRPVIIGELVMVMRKNIGLLNDRTTLEEMLTFVRNEHLRAEAESGMHDDLVLGLAIAYHIRGQQSMSVPVEKKVPHQSWTRDMREDFGKASPKEREYLLEIWGKPR